MKHIMVDLETFGTRPYSSIISIGAVYFDPNAGMTGKRIKSEFYVTIDPTMSEQVGFRADMSTVCWWLDPARASTYKEWFETLHFDPQTAFFTLNQWVASLFDLTQDMHAHDDIMVKERSTFDPTEHVCVWGNGATFDNTLLRQGFELLKIEPFWKHWNDRCFRTMKNLVHTSHARTNEGGEVGIVKAKDMAPPHEGKHNALLDARQQALWLCNIARNFDLTL